MNNPEGDVPTAAETTRRSRIAHKWSQFLMWWPPLRWMWVKLSIYIFPNKYTEAPNYNRVLAGLRELTWMMTCGYGWKFGWKMAMIYWRNSPEGKQ